MRTITKEELVKILERHKEWLTDNSKGERANLSYANLSYADLRFADLRRANLRSADLSYANLSYADLRYADLSYVDLRYVNLLIFQYQRHVAYFTGADGMLRIGCHFMPVSEWLIRYEELGRADGYTDEELKVYGAFIKQCAKIFNRGKT